MSALKVIRRGYCNDCGQLHGRPYANVALCYECRTKRLRIRSRTFRYRVWKLNYGRSPRGKILRSLWEDRNRERRKQQGREWYRRQRKPYQCEAVLCANTFMRIAGSHRRFCVVHQEAFFGSAYLKRGKAA